MTITIVAVITAIIVTAIICYFIPKGKIQESNKQLQDEKQRLQLDIKDAENKCVQLDAQFQQKQQSQNARLQEELRKWETEKSNKNLSFIKAEMQLKENVAALETQIEEKKQAINTLDAQSKQAIKLVEAQVIDNMTTGIEQQGKELCNKYEKLESDLLLHYTILRDEQWDSFLDRCSELDNKIIEQELKLCELEKKAKAITESNKKAELEQEQKDFYRLQLSALDIEEIQKIRSIEPYLRKKEPLNKVIWKVYYEKPYNDLIGRVVGTGIKCGIYKITHIDSGKCYVGQSNNIAERWRQHIKRGIGADPPTQNKLYPAMLEFGAENFMFEILEECSPMQLTEREKYYTEIYDAQSYGYVARKG